MASVASVCGSRHDSQSCFQISLSFEIRTRKRPPLPPLPSDLTWFFDCLLPDSRNGIILATTVSIRLRCSNARFHATWDNQLHSCFFVWLMEMKSRYGGWSEGVKDLFSWRPISRFSGWLTSHSIGSIYCTLLKRELELFLSDGDGKIDIKINVFVIRSLDSKRIFNQFSCEEVRANN